MQFKISIYAILFLGLNHYALAQDTLSLSQAFEMALEQNYGIKVARNQLEINKNSATRGNAGMLPRVTTSAGINYSNDNIKLEFANTGGGDTTGNGGGTPNEITQSGAETWLTTADITATYRIFDGFNNRRNYERLKLNVEESNILLRQQIETTLLSVARSYYDLARVTQDLVVQREALAISQERLTRASNKNDYGVSNRLEVLNAEVDLNTDSVNLVSTELQVEIAKRNLNVLLSRDPNTVFEVSLEVLYTEGLSLDALKESAKTQNVAIRRAQIQKQLSQNDLEVAKGARYPTLDASASYRYNRSDNEVGLLLLNRTAGFTTGLTLSFDIFDGNRKNLQIQNARISVENNQQQYQEAVQNLERDIENAYATLQNRSYILEIEERNLTTAEANFDRTREQFNFGQVTNTQFREAQLNLITARNRQTDAKFDRKIAEIELLQLSGNMLEKEE